MPGSFREPAWSLESIAPPWDGSSIYDHILLHGSDPLPDDAVVQGKSKLRWSGGAWDGVMGHHARGADSSQRVSEIVGAVHELARRAEKKNIHHLYKLVTQDSLLHCMDAILEKLADFASGMHGTRLLDIGRYFTKRAAHREAVKFGIALMGLMATKDDVETLKIIGSNDEFTLYTAVALARIADGPEQALWQLAKNVRGWGRIQAVERLQHTENPQIQAWMLREGFRNEVMNEYLACICARTGRLHEALNQEIVDDALLDGAADIIRALIQGGPAEDMDDYEHAADACEAYINRVWARSDLGLKHFIAVAELRSFLLRTDGWEKRYTCGWTEERRQKLIILSNDVFGRPTWRRQALEALSSPNDRTFFEGDMASEWLSTDTWEAHFSTVKAAPLTSTSWYRLMKQTDESRIDRVLAFAESVLPFPKIETGPGDELGIGPGFEPHRALDWVLQDLGRFPNRGWRLIQAGLRSPVVRNRNMAIQALASWTNATNKPEVISGVREAYKNEPRPNTKSELSKLLQGKLFE